MNHGNEGEGFDRTKANYNEELQKIKGRFRGRMQTSFITWLEKKVLSRLQL